MMQPAAAGPQPTTVQRDPASAEKPIVERDSRGRPNLCHLSDLIVIARVDGRESRKMDAKYAPTVYTRSTLRVERIVRGQVQEGQQLAFDLEGGEAEGIGVAVPGNPSFGLGTRYLLFLRIVESLPQPVLQGHYRVPVKVQLPSESILREVWMATCAAHPEGIFYLGPSVRLAIPKDVAAGSFMEAVLRDDRVQMQGEQ